MILEKKVPHIHKTDYQRVNYKKHGGTCGTMPFFVGTLKNSSTMSTKCPQNLVLIT